MSVFIHYKVGLGERFCYTQIIIIPDKGVESRQQFQKLVGRSPQKQGPWKRSLPREASNIN